RAVWPILAKYGAIYLSVRCSSRADSSLITSLLQNLSGSVCHLWNYCGSSLRLGSRFQAKSLSILRVFGEIGLHILLNAMLPKNAPTRTKSRDGPDCFWTCLWMQHSHSIAIVDTHGDPRAKLRTCCTIDNACIHPLRD